MDDFGGSEFSFDSPGREDSDPDSFGDTRYEASTPSSANVDPQQDSTEHYAEDGDEEEEESVSAPAAVAKANPAVAKQFRELRASGMHFVVYLYEKYGNVNLKDDASTFRQIRDLMKDRFPTIFLDIEAYVSSTINCEIPTLPFVILFEGDTDVVQLDPSMGAGAIAERIIEAAPPQ